MKGSSVSSPRMLLRAGAVLPISGRPIDGGAVRVRDGLITAVGPAAALPQEPGEALYSLPDCVLLPGLVNAHCHLELGGFHGRVPCAGTFTEWILSLIGHGRPGPDEVDRAVAAGARALLAGGCTAVGDITTTGLALAPLRRSGIRAVSFRELLGLTPERVDAALAEARDWLRPIGKCEVGSAECEVPGAEGEVPTAAGRVRLGVSPHAPYSTAARTYREAAALAAGAGVPVSTHLSESLEEIEFVATGGGGFLELLRFRGIPREAWDAPGVSPVRYLAGLGVLGCRGAAAHVNYLLPGDLELLSGTCLDEPECRARLPHSAAHNPKSKIENRKSEIVPVYCPGSHRFFRHAPHPAGKMLRAGIPVALGTDSLASNERLDMLEEARLAWHSVPGTTAADWVRAATLSGARALCLEDLCGALEPGKAADLVAIRPGAHASDVYAAVLSAGSRACLTLVAGQVVWSAD